MGSFILSQNGKTLFAHIALKLPLMKATSGCNLCRTKIGFRFDEKDIKTVDLLPCSYTYLLSYCARF